MAHASASVSTRRRLSVEDRRQELISAALELFSSRPVDEVTLDDVAAKAGVSRALAYRYFGSRGEIYLAAMRSAADEMLALLDPPHDADPLTRVTEAIRLFFEFAEAHATGFQALLSGHSGARAGTVGTIVEEVRRALFDRLVEGMGRRKVSADLRLALTSWIAAAEAAAKTRGAGTYPGFPATTPARAHDGFDDPTAALDPRIGGDALATAFSVAERHGVEAHGVALRRGPAHPRHDLLWRRTAAAAQARQRQRCTEQLQEAAPIQRRHRRQLGQRGTELIAELRVVGQLLQRAPVVPAAARTEPFTCQSQGVVGRGHR